jgi:hypothetical protein
MFDKKPLLLKQLESNQPLELEEGAPSEFESRFERRYSIKGR